MATLAAITQDEKARLVGVSPHTLYGWYRAGLDRHCTVEEAVAWRAANRHKVGGIATAKERAAAGDGTLQEQLMTAQIAKTEAEAEAKQIKNRVLSGELVDAEDVRRVWSQACAKVRARLEIMPQEASKDMPATREELIERLSLVVRAVLNDLSEISVDDSE